MNIELIRREIMGLAFTYDSCARILYKEKLRADLFEDYKKMYIDLMEHCGESHNEFNCIEYAVLNPIVSELMFECKSSHINFEKLLNTFKALSFKNKLEMNINKANSILSDDSNKSILEAYKIIRQDIDLYKEEGKSESFSDMSTIYDFETKREFLDLGYPSLENLNVEPTDFILIGARPSMG